MKFTLSWLKDYLHGDYSLNDVEQGLVHIGLEVESVTNEAVRLKDFIVADIIETRRHPEADRLQICTVNTGTEAIELVCGGKNARKGIKVVLARVGVTIPSTGQILKAGKVRGVDSPGMLCSSDELLINVPCDGILELETDLSAGAPAAVALNLIDPIIDIAITPNRSDCFAIYGIARDLYAYFKTRNVDATLTPLKTPTIKGEVECPVKVTNDAPDACYQFGLTYIKGVANNGHNSKRVPGSKPMLEAQATAKKMTERLRAVGLRTISPLVDITNYLCFDLGRPLHVFDADKIQGNIRLRLAHNGETFEALDEKTYTLSEGMLVICDDAGIISLAGIMGGARTGCNINTTNVLVESAWFDPINIAQTGQKLNIISDSRMRFERGVDPMLVESGMHHAVHLIQELCSGKASEAVWLRSPKHSYTEKSITLTLEKLVRVTGETFFMELVVKNLENLGFIVEKQDMNAVAVTVPSWRPDVSEDIDLVEEIVRLRGTDAIQEVQLPMLAIQSKNPNARSVCAQTLVSLGYVETVNFSFTDHTSAALFGASEQLIHLKNPITEELTTMRPSLVLSLLCVASDNQKRAQETVPVFEIAHVYGSHLKDKQTLHAAGLWAGKNHPRHWRDKQQEISIFDMKDHVMSVLSEFSVKEVNLQITSTDAPPYYHPGRSGVIKQGNRILGYFGQIHPKITKHFDVSGTVCAFELLMEHLPPLKQKRTAVNLSPYQPVERDFAFLVDQHFEAGKLSQLLTQKLTRQQAFPKNVTLERVDIFDIFNLPNTNKKSIAVSLRFQPEQATLNETDLETMMKTVTTLVEHETGGTLRQ